MKFIHNIRTSDYIINYVNKKTIFYYGAMIIIYGFYYECISKLFFISKF